MKKIIIGMFALTMVSATSVFAGTGDKGKSPKAKVVCTKACPDTKCCQKNVKCPNKPGCVCN